MTEWIHPGFLYLFGALLIPLIQGRGKKLYLLLIPILSIVDVAFMRPGTYWSTEYLGFTITLGRVDKLSLCFAWVFTIMALLSVLYGLHRKEDGHHMAAYFYVGSSLGAIFAGDYLSLFIFWEIMAVSSVFLIWYRGEPRAIRAGFRYLMVHVFCPFMHGFPMPILRPRSRERSFSAPTPPKRPSTSSPGPSPASTSWPSWARP